MTPETIIEVGDTVEFTSADGQDEYTGQVWAIEKYAVVFFVVAYEIYEVVPMALACNQQFCQLVAKYGMELAA